MRWLVSPQPRVLSPPIPELNQTPDMVTTKQITSILGFPLDKLIQDLSVNSRVGERFTCYCLGAVGWAL